MGATVIAARRTVHPGKPRPDRVIGAVALRPRRALIHLPEGQTLQDALVAGLVRCGVRAAAFHLLGGRLSAAAYHVARPAPGSARAVEYGPPIRLAGDTRIVKATGSYGEDLSGNPLLHIHGVLAAPDGAAHGGHIAPEGCVIGPGGIRAIAMLTIGFKQFADRETRYSLFFPVSEAMSHVALDNSSDQHWTGRQRPPGA